MCWASMPNLQPSEMTIICHPEEQRNQTGTPCERSEPSALAKENHAFPKRQNPRQRILRRVRAKPETRRNAEKVIVLGKYAQPTTYRKWRHGYT